MECRPEKFYVIPEGGKSYSVALASSMGQGGGPGHKGRGRPPPDTSWNSPVVEVIRDVKEQLYAQGGCGIVWIDDWWARYSFLGATPREFLESRPDKFIVIPGAGKQYTVALASQGKLKGSKSKQPLVGKGVGAHKADKTLEEQARDEAVKQLAKAGNVEGRVWISNWNRKFKDTLGSLREFLEGDDHFIVTPGEGSKYTVELVDTPPDSDASDFGAKAKKIDASDRTLEEQATQEAIRQLKRASNTEGRVWIGNWNRKFKDSLGTLREFLEESDRFVVTPGEGTRYTVALVV